MKKVEVHMRRKYAKWGRADVTNSSILSAPTIEGYEHL